VSGGVVHNGSQPDLAEFVASNGNFWSSVHLGDGAFTRETKESDRRLRCFVQAVADIAGKPLNQLRILDVACYEGHYSIEFGLHGAQVVGIEGRDTNLNKARFLKDHFRLGNVSFYHDDVRNVREDRYGRFDVILCAGILYHLDAPAVCEFIKSIHSVCDRLAIFETYVSMKPVVSFTYNGRMYWGSRYVEHDEKASASQKHKDLWASIDNPSSFWLTQASLCNALVHAGFTSAFVQLNPSLEKQPLDRHTFIALTGSPARVLSSPLTDAEVDRDWTEANSRKVDGRPNVERSALWRLSKRHLPQPVKDVIKGAARKLGIMKPPSIPDFNQLLPPRQRQD
jgi:Methyltransferase domain